MATLLLTPEDRAKYGLPDEPITFDLSTIGLRTQHAMKATTGFSLLSAINAVVDPPEGADRNLDAVAAMAWMVLRASGFRVDWETFDPAMGMRFDFTEPAEPATDENADAADAPADAGAVEPEPALATA